MVADAATKDDEVRLLGLPGKGTPEVRAVYAAARELVAAARVLEPELSASDLAGVCRFAVALFVWTEPRREFVGPGWSWPAGTGSGRAT